MLPTRLKKRKIPESLRGGPQTHPAPSQKESENSPKDTPIPTKKRRRRSKNSDQVAESVTPKSVKSAKPEEPKTEKRISANKLKKQAANKKTDLDKEIAEVQEILKTPQFTENTYMQTYGHMFDKLLLIMHQKEELCLTSDKSTHVYSLMQVYNQMREVIADIRAILDLGQQVDILVRDVLRPVFLDISHNATDMLYRLRKSANAHIKDPEAYREFFADLTSLGREHGKYMQDSYHRAAERIDTILTENK